MTLQNKVVFDSTGITVNPGARDLTVIAFSHAGASVLSLLPLMKTLPSSVRVRLVELPGRGLRNAEAPARTFKDALADIAADTESFFTAPCLLFGHSLGGLMADGIMRSVSLEARSAIRGVVLSACSLHSRTPAPESPIERRSDPILIETMHRFEGTPPEVFQSPSILRVALAVLGDDMRLIDSYGGVVPDFGFSVPFEIWYGADDETVQRETALQWRDRIGSDVEVFTFPGRHFYLFTEIEPTRRLGELALRLISDERTRTKES